MLKKKTVIYKSLKPNRNEHVVRLNYSTPIDFLGNRQSRTLPFQKKSVLFGSMKAF